MQEDTYCGNRTNTQYAFSVIQHAKQPYLITYDTTRSHTR